MDGELARNGSRCSPGIFRFAAKAGWFKMRTAVTEDKALLGSNLSAGDGPKLAGVASGRPFLFPRLPGFSRFNPLASF